MLERARTVADEVLELLYRRHVYFGATIGQRVAGRRKKSALRGCRNVGTVVGERRLSFVRV